MASKVASDLAVPFLSRCRLTPIFAFRPVRIQPPMPRKRRQPEMPDPSESSPQAVAAVVTSAAGNDAAVLEESPLTSAQWTTLRKRILADQEKQPIGVVFGDAVWRGTIYRWGAATALQTPCDIQTQWLTRTAVGASTGGKRFRTIEPDVMVRRFQESLIRSPDALSDVWNALVWSAAMPGLLQHLEEPIGGACWGRFKIFVTACFSVIRPIRTCWSVSPRSD